jgi:hypothetical protein
VWPLERTPHPQGDLPRGRRPLYAGEEELSDGATDSASPSRTKPGSPRTVPGWRPGTHHEAAGFERKATFALDGGGAEESDGRSGQTGPEARWHEKRRQELSAGGRAAEGGWPGEGTEATGRRESARRAGCGAGDGGVRGKRRAPWRNREGTPAACPARCSHPMPLTAHACKGISATRRARIEAAIEAAGRHVAQPYKAWIAAAAFRGDAGLSSRGRGKRPSASHAPPRAGGWPPRRGSAGRAAGKPRWRRRRR